MTNPVINGWINLYKPRGISSAKALYPLKKILGRDTKIGHGGTLDPLAEGVLPVAVGEATKTVAYVQADTKIYEFEVTWGESRTTDDAEGDVTRTSEARPTESEINAALPALVGTISQTPPAYSALKVEGQRAYDLARRGTEVSLQPRDVEIHALILLASTQDTATFRVTCGKGTYVRSLARDIAGKLGACGYVSQLIRTQVGRFTRKNSVDLQKLVDLSPKDLLCKHVFAIVDVLDDIPAINIDAHHEQALRYGQEILAPTAALNDGDIVLLTRDGTQTPIALAEYGAGTFKSRRVFNIDLEIGD